MDDGLLREYVLMNFCKNFDTVNWKGVECWIKTLDYLENLN